MDWLGLLREGSASPRVSPGPCLLPKAEEILAVGSALLCSSQLVLAEGGCALCSSAGYSRSMAHVVLSSWKCQRDAPRGSRSVDVGGTARRWLYTGACKSSFWLVSSLEEWPGGGLLVFGLSWALSLTNYSQQLPVGLRAMFCEHIRTLQTSQSKNNSVKGAVFWWPRPCAPLTRCSFFEPLVLSYELVHPF